MDLGDRISDTAGAARRAAAGSNHAFGTLYEQLAPAIYAYACCRVGWNRADAEDVVAEVWLRARQRFDHYDPGRPFRAWVFGFARRVVREAQKQAARAQHRRGLLSGSESWDQAWIDQATGVSTRIARREELGQLVDWIRKLTRYEREVLLLRGLEGRPHQDVAVLLGRTPEAVQKCWERLLPRIRARGNTEVWLAT